MLSLAIFVLSFCHITFSYADDWEIREGISIQRYCRGDEVRYSNIQPKDFQLCLTQENKGSFTKIPEEIKYKDFSDDKESREMSQEERKQFARDLEILQKKREQQASQDVIKELDMIFKRWRTDSKFRKQMMDSLTPEERAMLEQFQGLSIGVIRDVSDPKENKRSR